MELVATEHVSQRPQLGMEWWRERKGGITGDERRLRRRDEGKGKKGVKERGRKIEGKGGREGRKERKEGGRLRNESPSC